eukprot:gene43077-53464_t
MDFDFRHIAVPFRMQPGLQRMAPGATHVTPLAPHSTLYAEKLCVHRTGQAQLCMPGFDVFPPQAVARLEDLIKEFNEPLP